MMQADPRGYTWKLAHGWQLTVSAHESETVAWSTNDHVNTGFYETVLTGHPAHALADMAWMEYQGTVFYDGGDTPPIILFQHPDHLGPVWMLAPATGAFAELEGVY